MAGAKMLAAALLMTGAAMAVHGFLLHVEWPMSLPEFCRQLIAIVGAMSVGVLTYGLSAALFRCRELSEFRDALRRRRKNLVANKS